MDDEFWCDDGTIVLAVDNVEFWIDRGRSRNTLQPSVTCWLSHSLFLFPDLHPQHPNCLSPTPNVRLSTSQTRPLIDHRHFLRAFIPGEALECVEFFCVFSQQELLAHTLSFPLAYA